MHQHQGASEVIKMNPTLGNKEVPEVVAQSVFKSLDVNEDGHLSDDEVEKFVEGSLGLDPEKSIVAKYLLDSDGDGTVTCGEFSKWLRSKGAVDLLLDEGKFNIMVAAVELFQKYDADGNHALSMDEVAFLMEDLGHNLNETASLTAAFKELDRDGNGRISFIEFLRWLNWIPMPPSPVPLASSKTS